MITIAVTPGDPEGVGPEIVCKAIRDRFSKLDGVRLLCVGAKEPFEKLGARIELTTPERLATDQPKSSSVWLLPAPTSAPKLKSGKPAFLPGYQSGWAIQTATRLVLAKKVAALATGPISKERLQRGGHMYPGHTEFLADLCKRKDVTMMLANETLRISLVTTHLALKDVPRKLTARELRRAVLHTADHLRKWWGIDRPKIAVAALNPHAGESGLFGKEEIRVITPELRKLQKALAKKAVIEGPLPADTLFAKHVMASAQDRYDAVVCMYHDQGLIPVKLLDFPKTVNITLGLPMIRTSVDHGVGFDIAGTGKADPSSMISAIDLAIQLSRGSHGTSN